MTAELERQALACVLPGFEGPVAPDWVRRRLADGLGGVVLPFVGIKLIDLVIHNLFGA